ncbi:MAG: pyridoxal-5'-phosphate-dependent protein subunit beta [Pelagibacteraceae bacterium]|nr:pyridoxal-5'-phosphate-dependent protein subunit beta [Pelagibacteraceae bacterium]MBT4951781.1 pyridoxal-5'-phosphate-dependent protein subunit beta [Pelagibacteraceae bacterium]MBT5214168.1 pyridoxal-5'-phosphate-dependent protein subunit beta [Pelagibacteraceae bacterium]
MNSSVIEKTANYFRSKKVVLPTIAELKNPHSISEDIKNKVLKLDKDAMDPANLFRVHWFNKRDHSKFLDVPEHIVLPSEFTGVEAKIIVNLGRYFPLITAHKVLAAYGCLLPRILNGSFDYTTHKAVWPSTGNYCRGGVAISKILGFKSVAILPEGMSKERFDWLEKWVEDKNDIIKTTGTESNVKEIYDACNELEKDKNNDIINQFDEYYNYATHRAITGSSFEKSFLKVKGDSNLQARFYVSASGSSGTLAAGDYLKENLNAQIAVVEATECPTLLYNGYGEHNIQGIGDKHVPLIHNVMNSDYVVGVSDEATNNLNLLFNTDEGRKYLTNRRGLNAEFVGRLPEFGFSSIANIIASIKLAKKMKLTKDDAIITVATDGADLYKTELAKTKKQFSKIYDQITCAEIFAKNFDAISVDHTLELSQIDKERIFNLGYYTWVEQQGTSLEEFENRRNQSFWDKHYKDMISLDEKIKEFNSL